MSSHALQRGALAFALLTASCNEARPPEVPEAPASGGELPSARDGESQLGEEAAQPRPRVVERERERTPTR